MKFLTDLFKPKPKKTYHTQEFGILTLLYSKGKKNLWCTDFNGVSITVQGTNDVPNSEQVAFLKNYEKEISKIDSKITKRFKEEFEEVNLPADFNHWKDRFKIVGVETMIIFEGEAYWNITFEDLKSPYAHFTLFIEGEKLTDFSIDT